MQLAQNTGLHELVGPSVRIGFVRLERRGWMIDLEEVIEQGDILAARFTLGGRHVGELLGVAATGREITIRGATFMRFRDGRIAERWQHADDLGLLQQLGLIPA